MIKTSGSITETKSLIESLKSKSVNVIFNLGRNKYVEYNGTLVGVYPALFTISPEDKDFKGKTSYSYSEYMCGKVKISERV